MFERIAELEKQTFTPEERKKFAVKAVNRLIADVQEGRLKENKELAERIAVCVASSEHRNRLVGPVHALDFTKQADSIPGAAKQKPCGVRVRNL